MSRAPPGGKPGHVVGMRQLGSDQQKPPSQASTPRHGSTPSQPFGDGSQVPYGGPQSFSQPHGNDGPSGPPTKVKLGIAKVEDKTLQSALIYGNICAVSAEDFPPKPDGTDYYILLKAGQPPGKFVVTARPVIGFPRGCISLSDPQRTWCRVAMRDTFTGVNFDPFASGGKAYLGTLDLEVGFASSARKTTTPYDEDELVKLFLDTFKSQIFAPGQRLLMDIRNLPLLIIVTTVQLIDMSMADNEDEKPHKEASFRGILSTKTSVRFHRDAKGDLNLKPSVTRPNSNPILAANFQFEDLGIGGLTKEFSTIFRRTFVSRLFPPGIVAKMGIAHVKGMLLYGPPGTGKTLIARQIGNMLNAKPPKVINGPEVLNKYVGQSEENIRNLFADAEKEFKEKGDESDLHIIIFDELDAVCRQRGTGVGGGTGVGDSIVNQLLSKLDGVDQLNNILLIGMTNRKDMIDEALLRPGRLEVHIEISLPNRDGRLEILKIQTAKMSENNMLEPTVDLEDLASRTNNYSGAELSGVVRAATSFAMSRHIEVGKLAAVKADVTGVKVDQVDFTNALIEVRPAYGVSDAELSNLFPCGFWNFSGPVKDAHERAVRVVRMVESDSRVFSSSVLFHGMKGSGKTALAAYVARNSNIPFVRAVTPLDLIGYSDDYAKKSYIHKVFTDAYKSPISLLILDDFERLIGWNPVGPRFSNVLLEALTTLIASKPPKGHRLLTFVTTSQALTLRMLDVESNFDTTVAVPAVSNLSQLRSVLEHSITLDKDSIDQTVSLVQQRTGSESMSLGVKTIIRCISEARINPQGGNVVDMADSLSNLIVEKMGQQ
ncbi:P-loop containing nucleoside triphosphate hydrolase protein [Trichoderma chlorosporum]